MTPAQMVTAVQWLIAVGAASAVLMATWQWGYAGSLMRAFAALRAIGRVLCVVADAAVRAGEEHARAANQRHQQAWMEAE